MTASIKWVTALLVLSSTALITGCNTIKGAGKDIERGGEVIQKCADRDDPTCKR